MQLSFCLASAWTVALCQCLEDTISQSEMHTYPRHPDLFALLSMSEIDTYTQRF